MRCAFLGAAASTTVTSQPKGITATSNTSTDERSKYSKSAYNGIPEDFITRFSATQVLTFGWEILHGSRTCNCASAIGNTSQVTLQFIYTIPDGA
jgi:hypothetical protein